MRRRSRSGERHVPLLLAVLLCLLLISSQPGRTAQAPTETPAQKDVQAMEETDAREPDEDEASDAALSASTPSRPMTRGEIQRELDEVRRELEELLARVGDAQPTPSQLEKLQSLTGRLSELNKQLAAADAQAEQKLETAGTGFYARWITMREGIRDFAHWDVNNGMLRLRMGLRLQLDQTFITQSQLLESNVGSADDSLKGRRVRVFADGRILRRMDFKFEYDFSADQGLKDAYVEGGKFLKVVRWRIGHFKEPFSLGRQNSANYLGFMEWALPVQAIAPGRNWGLMVRHSEASNRMTWAVSATTTGQATDDNRTNSKVTLTGRVTGLPYYRDGGRRLLHLGFSYRNSDSDNDTARLFARPEARFAPIFIDTGDFQSGGTRSYALETAVVHGPYWGQAEWIRSDSDSSDLDDPDFGGWYVEAGWFMTGESRFYRVLDGTFGRLTPNTRYVKGNPFKKNGIRGAIEFVARYSTLDLNSGPIQGGKMGDFSVGVNWYLTQATRIMANYIHSNVDGSGNADLFLIRYQFNP